MDALLALDRSVRKRTQGREVIALVDRGRQAVFREHWSMASKEADEEQIEIVDADLGSSCSFCHGCIAAATLAAFIAIRHRTASEKIVSSSIDWAVGWIGKGVTRSLMSDHMAGTVAVAGAVLLRDSFKSTATTLWGQASSMYHETLYTTIVLSTSDRRAIESWLEAQPRQENVNVAVLHTKVEKLKQTLQTSEEVTSAAGEGIAETGRDVTGSMARISLSPALIKHGANTPIELSVCKLGRMQQLWYYPAPATIVTYPGDEDHPLPPHPKASTLVRRQQTEGTASLMVWGRKTESAEAVLRAAHDYIARSRNRKVRIFQPCPGGRKVQAKLKNGKFKPPSYWVQSSDKLARSMESIVLPDQTATEILEDCARFISRQRWYVDRGIPWRRGYLLHGVPGAGKTSLVEALAGELQVDVFLLELSASWMTGDLLQNLLGDREIRPGSLVVIEVGT
jgi:hypothetical protein